MHKYKTRPKKNLQNKPFFDSNTFQQDKHMWIRKATGLGITEFVLRYITLDLFKR
jgi:uncharacterized membrane protein YcfT